jgi:hypothetical protein
MSNHFDLYAPIHKAIRHCMQSTLVQLGRCDVSDATDLAEAIAQVREMIAMLEAHLDLENRFVHTAVIARRADALGRLADDHEHHERSFAVILRDTDLLERTTAEPVAARTGRLHRLYLAVSRFVADNLLHMAVEETELNPVLWQLFTDDELRAIYQQVIASEGPETLGRTTRWLVPALAPEERAAVLIGARPGIPPVVFEQLLGVVEGLISPRDWTKLDTALAASASASASA